MKAQTIFEKQILVLTNNPKFRYKEVFDSLDILESSRRDYLYRIPHFLQYIRVNGFNANTYLEYKRQLATISAFSIATKNKYLVTARILIKELARRGIIPDTTLNVRLFTESRKHKRIGITEDEISLISKYLQALPVSLQNLRLKSIIALLVYQGLRISEVTQILVSDVDYVSNALHIKSKGNDHKEDIYLNPMTLESLRSYLSVAKISDGWLFPCLSNNGRYKHLSTRSIQTIVGNMLNELDISKSCHSFRHYFVTKLIKEYKADLTQVMLYSRHKSLSMLTVYNDAIQQKKDLPRFYNTFKDVILA